MFSADCSRNSPFNMDILTYLVTQNSFSVKSHWAPLSGERHTSSLSSNVQTLLLSLMC